LILTSTRAPSQLRIVLSQSSVNRPRSHRRIREKIRIRTSKVAKDVAASMHQLKLFILHRRPSGRNRAQPQSLHPPLIPGTSFEQPFQSKPLIQLRPPEGVSVCVNREVGRLLGRSIGDKLQVLSRQQQSLSSADLQHEHIEVAMVRRLNDSWAIRLISRSLQRRVYFCIEIFLSQRWCHASSPRISFPLAS